MSVQIDGLIDGRPAAEFFEQFILIDGHNDLPWAARLDHGYDWDRLDVAHRGERTHTDLVRLREGGVGGQFWSVYVPGNLPGDKAVVDTLEQIDAVYRLVEANPDVLGLATSPDELEAVFASGRIASMMGAEGGQSIGCSLGALRMLHRLGVRYLTLTHNHNVPWADSATDVEVHGGLSPFGEEVVREMNRLGMLVDLSHVSPGTMRHALRVSEAPVIFSHSSTRALCDTPRNVPDDVLASLAGNGGVCMITFVTEFLVPEAARWREEGMAAAERDGIDPLDLEAVKAHRAVHGGPRPTSTLEDVVRHLEHAREVAGIDHIGLGGDYDGTDGLPVGLEDVTGYPRLFEALSGRGWSREDLAKLAGANLVRTWRGAEDTARALQATRDPSLATIEQLDGPPA